MAQTRKASEALEALESTVNTILMHTGSVFADPSSCDPNRLARTSIQIKQVIPATISRFHSALDELEAELTRAKTVIKLDIANERAIAKKKTSVLQPGNETKEAPNHDKLDTEMLDAPESQQTTSEKPSNDAVQILDDPQQQPQQTNGDKNNNLHDQPNDNAQVDKLQDNAQIPKIDEKSTSQEEAKEAAQSQVTESKADANQTDDSNQDAPNNNEPAGGQDSIKDDTNSNPLLQGIEMYADEKDGDGHEAIEGLSAFSNSTDGFRDLNAFGDDVNFGANPDFDNSAFPNDFMQPDSNFDELFSFENLGNNNQGETGEDQGQIDNTLFDESFFNLDL